MIEIIRTNSDHPDFAKLTDQLDDELCAIYNTKKEDFIEYNRITGLPTVVLAFENNKAVGCGCFRKFDPDTVELKRMYITPDFRKKGAAAAMMGEMEQWAKELGYRFSFLETGIGQPAAIALYQKLGYEIIAKFGQYETSERSVCMKKAI